MDLTVNQWLGEFDPHTRSQVLGCVQQTFIHLTFNQNRKKASCFIIPGQCSGNTTDFDSAIVGSIPTPGANYGVSSVVVCTLLCESDSMGSFPI